MVGLRLDVILAIGWRVIMTLDEMWERLAQHQSYADQKGYGEAWAKMCAERTPEAVWAAWAAPEAAWAIWTAAEAPNPAVEWIEKAEGKN